MVKCLWGSQAMETDGAKMLESLLPSKFQHKVKQVKILEQSEIVEEVKFHASLEVNICRKEEAEEFFLYIASKNGTDMKAPRKEKVRMGYSSNRFNCGGVASCLRQNTNFNGLYGSPKSLETKSIAQ